MHSEVSLPQVIISETLIEVVGVRGATCGGKWGSRGPTNRAWLPSDVYINRIVLFPTSTPTSHGPPNVTALDSSQTLSDNQRTSACNRVYGEAKIKGLGLGLSRSAI